MQGGPRQRACVTFRRRGKGPLSKGGEERRKTLFTSTVSAPLRAVWRADSERDHLGVCVCVCVDIKEEDPWRRRKEGVRVALDAVLISPRRLVVVMRREGQRSPPQTAGEK